jgi:hypothetical protein
MLVRVSCKACHLSSIWTDDAHSFLQSVCLRYRHCQARLDEEEFLHRPLPLGPVSPVRKRAAGRAVRINARGSAVKRTPAARRSANDAN